MKSLITSIAILGLLGMVIGVGTDAADVVATVTPQIISVTVADGTVDYGILDVDGSNNTFDGAATADTQTITNTSNVSANIALRSSDAYVEAGVTDWDLVGTAAADDFVHSYDINASGPTWTVFPSDGTFGNTNTGTVVTLDASGGANDDATFDLKIDMPTSITDTDAHSIDVTVIASASS